VHINSKHTSVHTTHIFNPTAGLLQEITIKKILKNGPIFLGK